MVQKLYPLERSSETIQKEIKIESIKEKQEASGKELIGNFPAWARINSNHPVTTSSGRIIIAPKKLSF